MISYISLHAEPIYSFKSFSLNYLNWTKETESKTPQRDFSFLKLDGGFGYKWMDFYGYLTLENPTKSYNDTFPNNQRYVGYGDLDIRLKDNIKLHIQNFYSNSHDFSVNDFVIGFSYRYQIENFWIKPFLGVHHTYDTFYKGMNGYMTGWVFNYNFSLLEQNFSLFQWNEIEFARDKKFYEDNGVPIGDGKRYGLNGAISLWWYITHSISSGSEYRYADHKLGNIEYQAGYTYTLKYNF